MSSNKRAKLSNKVSASSKLLTNNVKTVTAPPFSLLSRISIQLPAQGSVDRKICIYFKDIFKRCLDECKIHFIRNSTLNIKVYTATPFLKAVDPLKYPDYAKLIPSPMDFNKLEKKVLGDRYPSISSIVSDMALLRDNAHTYNGEYIYL
jgi:hypothetical protein